MRRVVVLALLALALPIAASADIILTNQFGNIAITAPNAGLGTIGVTTITSSQSQLRSWGSTVTGFSMGSVSFSTGTLATGRLRRRRNVCGGRQLCRDRRGRLGKRVNRDEMRSRLHTLHRQLRRSNYLDSD